MSNPFSLGFVAVFRKPLDSGAISAMVGSWLGRFDRVEQVSQGDVATLPLEEPGDILWGEHVQFRVLQGDQFAWVYVTRNRRVAESTGMPAGDQVSLSLSVLTDLPGLEEIVPESDERRLEQLERDGIL